MILKKIFIFFFLIITTNLFANDSIITLVSVNNEIITNVDLEHEIKIIKLINNNTEIINKNLQKTALINLIEEKIKDQELKKNKLQINDITIDKYFKIFLQNNNLNEDKIDNLYKKLIKKKIEINLNWQKLINNKFSWRVNININEIEQKLKLNIKKNENLENLNKLKQEMIANEKNKKINVYSNFYLEEIKKKSLIKFYNE